MFRLKQIFFALTKSERVAFFLAAGTAAVSGVILAFLIFIAVTKPVPAPGGEYSEGTLGQPALVNPVLAASEIDKGLVRLVFSNLKDVAEKIEPSGDQRTWKVRIKENIFWHDGERLTSDDVIFTVQKIQDQASASPLAATWQGIAAQRLSELELQLSLVNPYAFFGEILRTLYILPKHVFEEIPTSNWRLSDFNLRPVGSGPYKFLSFEKKPSGSIIVYRLTAADNYFGEKPLIRNFNFKFFSSLEELAAAFNAGQADAFAGLEPQGIALVLRPYEILEFRLPSYYAVFLNQSKNIALKDRAVREALRAAVNRDELIELALGGRGAPSTGPIPTDFLATSNPPAATTSIDFASTTLGESGWKLNEDGVREKAVQRTKIPLEFTLAAPKINFLIETAEYLKGIWEKIGAKVNLDIRDPESIVSETIKNRDYEALLFGNVLSRSLDPFSFWHSSERFYPGLNIALFNSKKADGLIESIRQNLDEGSRKEQFYELQKVISDEIPAIFLYSPFYLYLSGKNIRGIEPGSISEPSERFIGAPKWYLKTARVLR